MGDSFKNSALHKELLEKYISIKRSRRRKKRVPANTWVTAEKLPSGYQHKRRKPPKIDDDDELDTALDSIQMNHCPTTNYDDSMVKNQLQVNTIATSNTISPPTPTTQVINQPLILEDFDVADIDDNALIDCLFTNLGDITMGSVDVEAIKFDQSQQSMTESQQLEFLNEIFKDHELNFLTPSNHQDLINFQLNNNFTVEPAQESILSSTSPFPSSMSSPSLPSTSPNQQSQPHLEDNQVPDLSSSSSSSSTSSLSPSPSPSPPKSTTSLSPCLPPSSPSPTCPPSTSPCPSSPPSDKQQSTPQPRPSYEYKKLFLLYC